MTNYDRGRTTASRGASAPEGDAIHAVLCAAGSSQSQFDVGKDETDIGETPLALLLDNLLVAFNAEVVGNTQCSNGRVRRFDRTEKGFPRICPRVLIIEGGARCMDVRVPTMPY